MSKERASETKPHKKKKNSTLIFPLKKKRQYQTSNIFHSVYNINDIILLLCVPLFL
jgi:hypothetical protein